MGDYFSFILKKIGAVVGIFLIPYHIGFAEMKVDIYGTSKKKSAVILKKFSESVVKLQSFYLNNINLFDLENKRLLQAYSARKNMLIRKIKQAGQFLFVDFQSVSYPQIKKVYTTIEVVDKNQAKRLEFISCEYKKKEEIISKNGKIILKIKKDSPIFKMQRIEEKADIIQQMIAYQSLGLQIRDQKYLKFKCPVFHCLEGFKQPQLQPFLSVFNEGAIKYRKLILDTLAHDLNPERRAAAALIVGHFSDPYAIISLLLPHIKDCNNVVRNNVMRVLIETIRKAKINHINVSPFLSLLDSPYTSDRNKALWILLLASDSVNAKKMIRKKIENLKKIEHLIQPNNHDIAALVLRKIVS